MTNRSNQKQTNEIAAHPLQTWEWGEFRKEWGNEITRILYKFKSKEIKLLVTLSKIPLTPFKIGTVLKGPKPTREMLNELKRVGKKHKAIFIKLEPNVITHPRGGVAPAAHPGGVIGLMRQYGCVPGKTLFTPTTFWIDLTKSEEELMKSFSSKTRYNIRLAQRKGVKVVEDNSDKAFEKYLKLTFETAKRQGFYAHNERYHRLMWKHLHKLPISNDQFPIARLLVAKYQKEIITAWILFIWKDFIYYPYGASSDKYRNVMANNLMMWEAIKLGKKLGCKTFDLWGREPGKGFTRFKEGYNPKVVEFIGSWDLVINPFLYWSYRVAEKMRWYLLRTVRRFTPNNF